MTKSEADYYFDKGNNEFDTLNYKGAIQKYSQAIRLKPDYAKAYCNRGNSRQNLQDFQGAIEDYSEAIRLKPDYATAFFNRGISKDSLQDCKGAIKDYSQAIKLKPDYPTAYYNRGISKDYLQDHKGAIQDYSQAIKLKPEYTDAYCNRGISKAQIKDFQGAIFDYSEAILLQPTNSNAYNNRGVSKQNFQDYLGAIDDYSQAISLKPDYAIAYNNRGNSKKHVNDQQGAQSDYLEALRLSPQPSPLHLFNLANLYLDMGLKNEALKRYNEGAKIVQMETEANLKTKFNLSDGNIQHVKSSIQILERLQKQVKEIRKQAQKKNRTDILQQLVQFDEAIFSVCVKAAEEKADQNQTERTWLLYESQLKEIKKRLDMVQKKVSKLEAKVEQMEKRIYTEERINNMIENIDSRKMSEFFKLLYNMLINHFMAYRMLSTGFFSESVREVSAFDNIVGRVCKAQSIIESLPILGDLVGIPFKILNSFRQVKSRRFNSVIADNINSSRLQSEAVITLYMSHLIEELINNNPFNANLTKAVKDEQKDFLKQVMNVFGEFKEKIYSKIFGASLRKFSFVQQVVTLIVARFTLQLYEVGNNEFSQHCKNEGAFTAFFMESFEDKTKKQLKTRNNNPDQINDSAEAPLLAGYLDNKETNKQKTCWRSFYRFFCCCWQEEAKI